MTGDAVVDHEHVDRARPTQRFVHDHLGRGQIFHVGLDVLDFAAASCLVDLLQRAGIWSLGAGNYSGASLRQSLGDAEPYAAARAGDQRDLSVEPKLIKDHWLPPSFAREASTLSPACQEK